MTSLPRLILLFLVAAVSALAEDATLTGPEVTIPGQGASRAREVWKQSVTASWPSVEPGLYHLKMDGLFLGERNVRFQLAMELTQGKTSLSTWKTASNRFTNDQTFPFMVTQKGPLVLSLTLDDSAREADAKLVEEQQLKAMEQPATTGVDDKKLDDFSLEDVIKPAGTESFLLRSASLERQPQRLVIAQVWPDKIHYRPGEQVTLDVTVRNLATEPLTGQVAVWLEYDLDSRLPLPPAESVTVPPGETVKLQRIWPADRTLGLRAVAEVTEGANTMRDSAVFSVADNVFEVSIQGWSRVGVMNSQFRLRQLLEMPQEDLDALSRESALNARRNYFNHIEMFSWAPDDFFNLAPKGDAWWSGTMTYLKVKRDILAELRALQKQGIRVLSYAQPFAIGLDTQKNMRTHPELFAYGPNGGPSVRYDYDLLKSRARTDMGLRPAELGGELNFFNLDTVDRGTDALIASWKMFGFDGVRFDNRYYRANNPITANGKRATEEKHLDPYSARNVKHLKQRLFSEISPQYLISHNNGYGFNTPENTLGWQETVKDGLMCMDEETCGASELHSRFNPWRAYMLYGLEARTACTELGGYYQLFAPGRGDVSPADMLYYLVACAVTGSHPIDQNPQFGPGGAYGEFMTRYADVVFASDRQALPEVETLVALEAPAEHDVWWKAFAQQREVDGKRWLILPIINPPVNERINTNPAAKVPPVLTGVTLLLKQPGSRAFFLTPEFSPMRRELAVEAGKIQLPAIAHMGFVVIEVTP